MEKNTFILTVVESLKGMFNEAIQIETVQVPKNNGVCLEGILIKKCGENLTPVIYIEEYYRQYLKGMSMKSVLDDIYDMAATNWGREMPDADALVDYGWVKERIMYKLINLERNREWLEDVPHREFCDLAIVYFVNIGENDGGKLTTSIKQEHMEKWGITEKRLYDLARKNTPAYEPVVFTPLHQIIREIVEKNVGQGCDKEALGALMDEMVEDTPLNVLTNRTGLNGAAVILYPDALRAIAEKLLSNLVLLPSSIHEWIVLRYDSDLDLDDLQQMVKTINQVDVEPENVLSDSVYIFDRENGIMSQVK